MTLGWKSNSSVMPSLRDKTSTAAAEQDPLISIEARQQYNSIGSSGSSQKYRNDGKSLYIKKNYQVICIVILLHKNIYNFYLSISPFRM